MNENVNKFLLAGDKFMPEMHLKQIDFTYSACNPFNKNKERIEKFMQTGNTGFIYKMSLIKLVFNVICLTVNQNGLVERTQSDKVLRDKAFKIAVDPKFDGYQRGLASMVYKVFDKKISGGAIKAEPNDPLAIERRRQIIKKFKKRKVYSSFTDNIWDVDLADMQSLRRCNKGIRYLFCTIDLFSKYAWVVPLNNKKGITIVNAFQKIISKGHKPNKIWVDQGGEFYNNLFKRFLKNDNIEMYSRYNEGKSLVAERFIRT